MQTTRRHTGGCACAPLTHPPSSAVSFPCVHQACLDDKYCKWPQRTTPACAHDCGHIIFILPSRLHMSTGVAFPLACVCARDRVSLGIIHDGE